MEESSSCFIYEFAHWDNWELLFTLDFKNNYEQENGAYLIQLQYNYYKCSQGGPSVSKKGWHEAKIAGTCIATSVVVETVSETSHLCWNNETIRFKSSLTSIIIESTYLTLNMNTSWGCFKVQVGWKNAFYGETGSRKRLGETMTIKKHLLTFTLSVNKIIMYKFSMFKSLDSIASVVGIFMYLTISKFRLQHWLLQRGGGGEDTTLNGIHLHAQG